MSIKIVRKCGKFRGKCGEFVLLERSEKRIRAEEIGGYKRRKELEKH